LLIDEPNIATGRENGEFGADMQVSLVNDGSYHLDRLKRKIKTMTLEEAQLQVDKWIKTYGVRYFSELTNMAILTEEVGELARIIARTYGEQSFKESDKKYDLADEMADVLWVLICLANQTGVDLEQAFANNIEKKTNRDAETPQTNKKLNSDNKNKIYNHNHQTVILRKNGYPRTLAGRRDPKDGPSAGIAMATAMISALTGLKVRNDLAMTGEITLRGRVLPVGGIKEKVLAAHRAGIKTLLLPKENKRDYTEIPENVRQNMEFVWVEHLDEVLAKALIKGERGSECIGK